MTTFRANLEAGKPQLGLCIMYPSPGVVERIGPDWDWIWIDGQHGEMGYHEVLELVRACNLIRRPAFVRVAGHEFGSIGLALDTGADGVIVPLVESVEEARDVVKAAKFPPLGGRSFGGRRPIDFHGRGYSDTANSDTLLIAQIESPQALANSGEIAAVPGIDALFLGSDDMALRRGGPKSNETFATDIAMLVQSCRKHGKFAVAVASSPEKTKLCADAGVMMIVCGADVSFLANGSKHAAEGARAVIGT